MEEITLWEKIKEECKKRLAIIIVYGALLLLLIFSNYIIDDHIIPRVQKQLMEDEFLQKSIKDGKYITVDKESFAKNYPVDAKKILLLQNDKLAEKEALNQLSSQIDKIRRDFQKKFSASQERLNATNTKIVELKKIIEDLTSKKLKVTLFISSQEIDKGYIVLNIKNRSISHLIENGKKYYIYGDLDSKEKLKARVEIATDDNFPENAAIGRVHKKVYHDLFEGSSSGARKATVILE